MQGVSISPYKESALDTPLIVELYIAQAVPISLIRKETALILLN